MTVIPQTGFTWGSGRYLDMLTEYGLRQPEGAWVSMVSEPCGREVGSLFWVFLDYPRIGSSVPGSASPAG